MRSKLQTGIKLCIECGRSEKEVSFRHGNQCVDCINRIQRENRIVKASQIKKVKAEYYENHRKELLAQQADYRLKNHGRVTDRARQYRKTHGIERAALEAIRHARKRATASSGTRSLRPIYMRARTAKRVRCYLCGRLIPMGKRHVDHIKPLSKGGHHVPENLAIACAFCNVSKKDKDPKEVGLLLWS